MTDARVLRVMKPDASGTRPMVESSRRGLGVTDGDLAPDADGRVHPNAGGMSVAPTPHALPVHRVPARLATKVLGASGKNADRIWCFGSATFGDSQIAVGLQLRLTCPSHGNVEPTSACDREVFAAHLAGTQGAWVVEEP